MKNFCAILSVAACVASTVQAGASAEFHAKHGHANVIRHRRHHVRKSTNAPVYKRASSGKKCKAKSSSASATAAAVVPTSTASTSGSSNSTSSSSSSSGGSCPSGTLSIGGICVGMLPDGGGDGGSQDKMSTLNSLVSSTGKKHAYFGQYAQAQSGSTFDGSQLLQVLDDLKESGAIFQPAVMPTGGWQGLTASDNSQAINICNVMKKFTDEGIEVWLRFAHEVNWYQSDGTYQGNAADFKAGWAAVAAACKSIAPDVKMFFTPNVAPLSQYQEYYPDDPSTVDIIGVDYYPTQGTNLGSAFVDAMQSFHDEYCSDDGPFFAIGETGLGYSGSASDKVSWMSGITSSQSSMKHMRGVAWFNYQKGYNFKICDPNDSSTTAAYVSYLQG